MLRNETRFIREAKYYEKLDKQLVRCLLCPWKCLLDNTQSGLCNVRKNIDGKLYTLIYGLVSSVAIDPIEKKPLFHFYPGAPIFSISSVGCNFKCPWCQNWEISQVSPEKFPGEYMSPEDVVKTMKHYKVPFLAFTYNEPIIWYEYMYDTARLTSREGFKNVIVSNGHINIEPLDELIPYIHAANIDVKAFNPSTYLKIIRGKLEAVLDAIVEMKRKKIHVETTYLVIPGLNDTEDELRKMTKWHLDNLGPETPLHLSRFYPMYKYSDKPSTPVETLEKLWSIAKEEGLFYVYIGNVPWHKGENTYCPFCGKLLIRRIGYDILEWNLDEENRCKYCGKKIHIIGNRWKKPS